MKQPTLFDPVKKPGEWVSPFGGSEHILPGMRIWASIKEQHPERLVLMRMGDFYELFGSDAEVASAAAQLTLVARNATADGSVRVAMCGFPVHTLELYQAKLVEQGHALVICEQEEWMVGKPVGAPKVETVDA